MNVRTAVDVGSGATAHMSSCKVVGTTSGSGAAGSDNWCVSTFDAAFAAEDCWFEGANSGVLLVGGPAASATLTCCTLVRCGDVQPFAIRATEGAAAVLHGCQVSIEPLSTQGIGSGLVGTQVVLSVGGGASLVLEGGTRVDAARRGGVEVVVAAEGAGSSLAVRGGCSIVGGSHHTVFVITGARAALDGSTVERVGPGSIGVGDTACVLAHGPGTSLAVRGCTLACNGPPDSSGQVADGNAPYALIVSGGAKATVTATRAEIGRVGVSGEGSSLVHSGLACSGGIKASSGGMARELPARAGAGASGGQGSSCAHPAAAGPSSATAPGGRQAMVAGPGGGSGGGPSTGVGNVGGAEAEAAMAGLAAMSVAGAGSSAGG
jgi:hypothetical protein